VCVNDRWNIGLLEGDPMSYRSVNPTWLPTLTGRIAGAFTLSDIVNVARDTRS